MKHLKFTLASYQNLILFSIPILLVVLLRLFGFDGLYGQDSYEYLRYTESIKTFIIESSHPGNYYWPVLYNTLGAILSFISGDSTLSLQLISCFAFSTTCIYILKILELLHPNDKSRFLYVLIFTLFCPFLLKMGLIIMSDALALAFFTLTVYCFLKFHFEKTSISPILVWATASLMTRYASLFITFPIVIYVLYAVLKYRKYGQFITAFIWSGVISIPFFIFQWGALFGATSNYFLEVWSVTHYFENSYTTQDGYQRYLFPNLVYVLYLFFHPGFIYLGGLLSIFVLFKREFYKPLYQKILLTCVTLYVLFLAGIPFQNPRVLGLVFPIVLILLFPGFQYLIKLKLIYRFYKVFLFVSFILQCLFFSVTFKPIFTRSIIEKELAKMVQPYQGKTLYSFDVDLAIKGRGLNFDFKNLYLERYYEFNTNDLILFDPSRYELQWKNKTPMLNWQFIEKNYTLEVLESHPEGWKLYAIK